jgi:Lrp/AsnC family transcriptional regulator for asnA, asnC and gidA
MRMPVTGGDGVAQGRTPAEPAVVLDRVNKAIIEQLQQDGRRSYSALGKAVGLSEAAVRQRVQKLTDAGVIQVVAVTDPLTLGFVREALVGIRATGCDLRELAQRLAEVPEIDYVVICSGSFDLLIELVCQDDEHLLTLINDVRSIPGVRDTETFVYLKLVKQTYAWGTP